MMQNILERKGSSKDIRILMHENGEVEKLFFHFSDRVSIFDRGPLPAEFPGLGQLRAAISGKIFKELDKAGFATHYCGHDVANATMEVVPLNIKELNIDYGSKAVGELLPLELLCRLALTSKFIDRIEQGEINRGEVERLMKNVSFRAGIPLHPGFVECSTKFEAVDRYLKDKQVLQLINQSQDWLQENVYSNVIRIFDFLQNLFRSAGFTLMDGKLEAGIVRGEFFILADSISPDELRLIGSDGQSYDKDPVRQWYESEFPAWVTALKTAKIEYPDDKEHWPWYPASPPLPLIEKVVSNYRAVAKAIGAI